jgi:hypothetical protein
MSRQGDQNSLDDERAVSARAVRGGTGADVLDNSITQGLAARTPVADADQLFYATAQSMKTDHRCPLLQLFLQLSAQAREENQLSPAARFLGQPAEV